MPPSLAIAGRAALLLGLTLALMPALRGAAASTRRLVLALGLAAALAVPALSAVAPAWRIEAPAALLPAAVPVAEPAPVGPATGGERAASARAAWPAWRPVERAGGGRAAWALWSLGAALVLAETLVGLGRASAMARRAARADARWAGAIEAACAATGRRADVRVTDELASPAVVGLWRPTVLVPASSSDWGDERRLAVLLHELAHVSGVDVGGHLLGRLVCAIYWFHPLGWLVARRLRVERELAADEAVLAAGMRPSSYAGHLLALAALPAPAPSGAVAMAQRSALGRRVEAIVARRRPPRLSRAGVALVSAGACGVALAVASASPAARASWRVSPAGRGSPGDASPRDASPRDASPRGASPQGDATIDPALQRLADEELAMTLDRWQAPAGVALVLDPASGDVLASAGRRDGRRDEGAADALYVPGSTFKAVTLAAALDEGALSPSDVIDCEGGLRRYDDGLALSDAVPHGPLPPGGLLAVSSNVGFSRIFDRLGGERFDRWARRFHFGESLDGAPAGRLPDHAATATFAGATAAIGVALTATPLQVAAAYATLASDGVYAAPRRSRRSAPARERVLRPDTARQVVAMLGEAVHGPGGTGREARVDGVRVAGKTGTSEWTSPDGVAHTYASFVGLVPADRARFVILVGVESPRGGASGGQVAAPAFARLAARALAR